jgi:hypothetical protein
LHKPMVKSHHRRFLRKPAVMVPIATRVLFYRNRTSFSKKTGPVNLCYRVSVGDSLEGPLKRRGNPALNLQKSKTKHTSSLTRNAHTRHGPRCGGPRGPPGRPSKTPPRARFASLEGSGSRERTPPRSRVHATLERGPRLPRAGSASLEAPSRAHTLPHVGTSI